VGRLEVLAHVVLCVRGARPQRARGELDDLLPLVEGHGEALGAHEAIGERLEPGLVQPDRLGVLAAVGDLVGLTVPQSVLLRADEVIQ
jgi:hypothetical protein